MSVNSSKPPTAKTPKINAAAIAANEPYGEEPPVGVPRRATDIAAENGSPNQQPARGKPKSATRSSNGKVEKASANAAEGALEHGKIKQPDYIIELKRKLHREIFERCLEKKMLQDLEFWND